MPVKFSPKYIGNVYNLVCTNLNLEDQELLKICMINLVMNKSIEKHTIYFDVKHNLLTVCYFKLIY